MEATPATGPGAQAEPQSASRQLLGRGSIYTLGTALALVSSALAIPAASRLLGSGEYGVITLALASQLLLIPIANLGLPLAILRFYFDREESTNPHLLAKRLAVSVPLVAFAIVGIVFASALVWAPQLLPDDPDAILVGIALALPGTAVGASMALLRAEERPVAFVSVAILSGVGGQVLGIGALLVTPTPMSYLAGYAVAMTIGGLVGLKVAGALSAPPATPRVLRHALQYSLPIVPSTLAIFVLGLGDRVVIQLIDGSSAVGKYQIGYAFGSIGIAFITSLQNAWLPITFGAGEESRWSSLAETGATVVRLAAFTAGFLALAAPTVLRLVVPGSYDPHLLGEVAAIVALTTLPVTVYVAHSQVLLWTKHTRPLAVITPLAAALNLGLVAVLLPPFGLRGAAAATVIALLVQALLTTAAAHRIGIRVPWEWRRNLDSYLLGSAAVALAILAPGGSLGTVVRLAGATACGLAFAWTALRLWRPQRARPRLHGDARSAVMGAGILVLGAALGALVGLVPGTLSLTGTIAIGLIGGGALVLMAFRRRVWRARPSSRRPGAEIGALAKGMGRPVSRSEESILRIPRLLFYLGAATVTLSSFRVAFGLTLSEMFFIGAFVAAALAVIAGRPAASVPNGLVAGVALFAAGGLISSHNAASPDRSVVEVVQAVYVMLLWAWAGATVLRSRTQLLTAMSLWTASAALNGLAAITQVAGFTALAGPLEGIRATGFTIHANDLGAVCAVALIPALMLATNRFRGRTLGIDSFVRTPRWIVVGLIAVGLVLSGSVTAMLAAFVAVLVWMTAPSVRASGRLAVVTALAFAVFAVALVGSRVTSPTERLSQVTSSSPAVPGSGTADVRLRTVERALSRIESDPVAGVGFDGAGGVVTVIDKGTSTIYPVHSAPVAAWYEGGILGFAGLLIVAFTLAKISLRSIGGGDESDLLIGLAIFAAGIAFVIVALASPFVFQEYGWYAAVLAVAWWARRQEEARGADAVVSPAPARRAIPAPMPHPVTR